MTSRGLEDGFSDLVHEVTERKSIAPAKRPASRVRSPRDTAALLLAAVLCLGLGACRTLSEQDVALIQVSRATFAADAADPLLPPQARQIALDAHDVLSVLEYSATGRDVPADVRARLHDSEAAR